ncbi:hypothetical protein KM043_005113 [Ampulex compressa]|nr:hypothetical protein KM043_005113 [Ampulex compressa]
MESLPTYSGTALILQSHGTTTYPLYLHDNPKLSIQNDRMESQNTSNLFWDTPYTRKPRDRPTFVRVKPRRFWGAPDEVERFDVSDDAEVRGPLSPSSGLKFSAMEKDVCRRPFRIKSILHNHC